MTGPSIAVLSLLFAGLFAANFPFISQRVFGFFGPVGKSLSVRFIELLVLYFLIGCLGLLLEKHAGQISPQGWEFYVITATLFLTFAFPGFVYRYLLKHHD
jgi:hypothetical protein